ncbi:15480_t:CDS:2 [Funneliformis geosporum]|nr:15480_t:CDS:2 [Funneliformis geosporum]
MSLLFTTLLKVVPRSLREMRIVNQNILSKYPFNTDLLEKYKEEGVLKDYRIRMDI